MRRRIVGTVLGSVALLGALGAGGAAARGPSTPGVVVSAWDRGTPPAGWRVLLSAWADARAQPSAALVLRADGIAIDGLTAHRVAAGDTVCAGDGHEERDPGPAGTGAAVRGVGPLAAGGGLLPDGSAAQVWIDLRDAGSASYGDHARVRVRPAPHGGADDDEGDACGSERVWTYDSGWRPIEQVTIRPEGQPAPGPAPPAEVAAFATPFCAVPPPAATRTSGTTRITRTRAQLRINQRIGQAAIRRLNAVQARLDAGLQARDLCGHSIGADRLGPGVVTTVADPSPVAAADPAPIVDPGRRGAGRPVRLTAGQLLINQRIYQAAIRRADGIAARLDAGLSGGDVAAGQVTRGKLADGLRVVAAAPSAEPAPTRTVIAARAAGSPRGVSLSVSQLRVNQRIARAAVLRANALIRRMETGFSGSDLQPGTLTAADLG